MLVASPKPWDLSCIQAKVCPATKSRPRNKVIYSQRAGFSWPLFALQAAAHEGCNPAAGYFQCDAAGDDHQTCSSKEPGAK